MAWVFKGQDYTTEKSIVDHINGVKSDNRAANLRWVTFQENIVFAHGVTVEMYDEEDKLIDKYNTIKELLEERREEFANIRELVLNFTEFILESRITNETVKIKRNALKEQTALGIKKNKK
jgi:hypothetical protein